MLTFDKGIQNCLKHPSFKIIKFHGQYLDSSLNGQVGKVVRYCGRRMALHIREFDFSSFEFFLVGLT